MNIVMNKNVFNFFDDMKKKSQLSVATDGNII